MILMLTGSLAFYRFPVSMFNGISTFIGNLMQKPSLLKNTSIKIERIPGGFRGSYLSHFSEIEHSSVT